jgi:hypothetical protein
VDAPPSDHHPTGINPRRDGERIAFARWLRLLSDGDKPQRNEEPSGWKRTEHRDVCHGSSPGACAVGLAKDGGQKMAWQKKVFLPKRIYNR